MKRRVTAAVLALVCLVCLSIPAKGFFPIFGGIPVIDSANLAENIIQTAKWVQQLAQMAAVYTKLSQQYSHMVHQARHIMDVVRSIRYRIPTTVWRGIAAVDTTGRIADWLNAVNTGIATVEAWERATTRRIGLPPVFTTLPSGMRERLETEIATIDLQDGSAVSAMDTLGRIRLAGPQIELALSMLENDTLSTDPDMHTEAAQMNKSNAIAVVQARALQDQNKLLVTNTELALVQLKQHRDAAVRALLSEAAFRTDGKAAMEAQTAGASDAMLNYRLP